MSSLLQYVASPFEPQTMANSSNKPVTVMTVDTAVKVSSTILAVLTLPLFVWMALKIMDLQDRTTRVEIDNRYSNGGITELRQDMRELTVIIQEIRKELKK